MEMRNRRPATGRKRCRQHVKNRRRSQRGKFNGSNRDDGRHFHDRRIHLAVREQRDGTFVAWFVRVVMDQCMQRRARGHRAQKQDKTGQQRGDDRLALPLEMAFHELQTICF